MDARAYFGAVRYAHNAALEYADAPADIHANICSDGDADGEAVWCTKRSPVRYAVRVSVGNALRESI